VWARQSAEVSTGPEKNVGGARLSIKATGALTAADHTPTYNGQSDGTLDKRQW